MSSAQAWRDKGLLWVLESAPERMRLARLTSGKNDIALLVEVTGPGRVEATWRWLTRIELLCCVVDTAPWAKEAMAALEEARPDPAEFPVVVLSEGDGIFTAIIDMRVTTQGAGLN